eukprot:4881338-Amphidinium_carterae.1
MSRRFLHMPPHFRPVGHVGAGLQSAGADISQDPQLTSRLAGSGSGAMPRDIRKLQDYHQSLCSKLMTLSLTLVGEAVPMKIGCAIW